MRVVEFRLAGGIMVYLLTLQASALLYRSKFKQIPIPVSTSGRLVR
jgi:hypothetical protein